MDHKASNKESQGEASASAEDVNACFDDHEEPAEVVVQPVEVRGNARQRIVNAARHRIESIWEERRLRKELDDALC